MTDPMREALKDLLEAHESGWPDKQDWGAGDRARAALAAAPQPAPAPADSEAVVCPECNGTGERDSGGTMPWGAPAMLPCDCGAQEAELPTPAPTADREAMALIEIVEGIAGAMKHGTWRDENGMRLKDTPEWVAFYNATRTHAAAPQPFPVGVGLIEQIPDHVLDEAESDTIECGTMAPQPAPADRETLVDAVRAGRTAWANDGDGESSPDEAIADALLARGLTLPGEGATYRHGQQDMWSAAVEAMELHYDFNPAETPEDEWPGAYTAVWVLAIADEPDPPIRLVEGGDDAA